jgi:hypothetical protein
MMHNAVLLSTVDPITPPEQCSQRKLLLRVASGLDSSFTHTVMFHCCTCASGPAAAASWRWRSAQQHPL